MLHKLEQIKDKYLAMEARMADPSVLSDPAAYSALMREYKKLTPIMEAYTAYLRAEQDLADALNSGKLRGAGIDVLETEPMKKDHPYLDAKNICITPHVAWGSLEARTRLIGMVADNIRAFERGEILNRVEL